MLTGAYKWDVHSISQEFKDQTHDRIEPNYSKVLKFQRYTDSLEECVNWCIASIKNDREQKQRELSHGTGAV